MLAGQAREAGQGGMWLTVGQFHSITSVHHFSSPQSNLCLLSSPFPRAHCPPHPRSDCSVLRLPFAVLFCRAGRGHGRGGLCLGHLTEKFSSCSKQSASMAHG